jgi:serine/threonine protein phosphatase PrpC
MRRDGRGPVSALLRDEPAGPALRLAHAARTDIGLARAGNEDAHVARPEGGLWAVADGMGGHQDGEWASQVIADALAQAPLGGAFEADVAAVAGAIRDANAAILTRSDAYRLRMGSTVAALVLREDRFAALWVGDSRIYRLRNGALRQITRDHTQVQTKVDLGLMTAAEARAHPLSHILTRAVGTDAMVEIDRTDGDVLPGDVFLVCSDGLHGVVPEAEIAAALAAPPELACEGLVALALSHGGPDNVTVAVVAVP